MERLTQRLGNGEYWLNECTDPEHSCVEDCGDCEQAKKAFARLAAYEDTGLTPAEIADMRDELERIYTALA